MEQSKAIVCIFKDMARVFLLGISSLSRDVQSDSTIKCNPLRT